MKSIEALFAQHDLEVFEVSIVPIHGGSLEVHVAPKGRRQMQASVATLRAEEERKGYDRFETYKAFAARVWQLRDALVELLGRYREQDKTRLRLRSAGERRDASQQLRNRTRVGATGDREEPHEGRTPDAGIADTHRFRRRMRGRMLICVLAWNFLDEFIAKEASYLRNGGEFIVPDTEAARDRQSGCRMTALPSAVVIFGASGFIGRNIVDALGGASKP